MLSAERKKEQQILYRQKKEDFETALKAINLIIGGMSEIEACKEAGANWNRFRNLIKASRRPVAKEVADKEIMSIYKKKKSLFNEIMTPSCWEEGLLTDILGLKNEKGDTVIAQPTDNFRTDYKKISEQVLSEQERKVIEKRYIEGRTFESIAKDCNFSKERIRQIYNKALKKLRHPKCIYALIYGINSEEYKKIVRNMENEYNKAMNNCYISTPKKRLIDKDYDKDVSSEDKKTDSTPVEKLGINARALNCLKKSGVNTISELSEKKISELVSMKGMGTGAFSSIIEAISGYGICIEKEEIPD